MRTNPATPTGDPIPNSVPRDGLAVRLAADAESLARVDLADDVVAGACAGAAVDVIIDGRVEGAPLVGAWLEGGGFGFRDGVGRSEEGEESGEKGEELHCRGWRDKD
jgi:hypothetical protein